MKKILNKIKKLNPIVQAIIVLLLFIISLRLIAFIIPVIITALAIIFGYLPYLIVFFIAYFIFKKIKEK